MIEYFYWVACFLRTLSFVFIIMLNPQIPTPNKTLSWTFFAFFITEVLFSFLTVITKIVVTSFSSHPFLLAEFAIQLNLLLISLWMIVYYLKYKKKFMKKSSACSFFLLVVVWAVLILTSTASLVRLSLI